MKKDKHIKITFSVAKEGAVASYELTDGGIKEAHELLDNPNVIKISVTKETPSQYLKRYVKEGGVVHG